VGREPLYGRRGPLRGRGPPRAPLLRRRRAPPLGKAHAGQLTALQQARMIFGVVAVCLHRCVLAVAVLVAPSAAAAVVLVRPAAVLGQKLAVLLHLLLPLLRMRPNLCAGGVGGGVLCKIPNASGMPQPLLNPLQGIVLRGPHTWMAERDPIILAIRVQQRP